MSSRFHMIRTLMIYKLLTPWQHGEELDDAVFRIASTIPLRVLKHRSYKIPGDELFGFDPNAFVQQLIQETGVLHVWEPVATKVTGDMRLYVTLAVGDQDPDTAAKRQARQLVWDIWSRFRLPSDDFLSRLGPETASNVVATQFADFVIDNIDLFRRVEASFRAGNFGGGVDLLIELEGKAQDRPWHRQHC